jgi:3-(3-hydroxy-phenyl)propionate hydroxylase
MTHRDLERPQADEAGSGMSKVFDTPLYPYERCMDQDAPVPVRHPVVVVGAGPVGLALAIDLAQQGVPVVVLDDNDRVSFGSRARSAFPSARWRSCDRLGCGGGRDARRGLEPRQGLLRRPEGLRLQPAARGRAPPAGLHQPAAIPFRGDPGGRLRDLEEAGAPVEIRGRNRVAAVGAHHDHVRWRSRRPRVPTGLEADWLVACDGGGSPVRGMLGLDFPGRGFEDCFLIADVAMEADFPTERLVLVRPALQPGPVGTPAQAARGDLADRPPARLGHRPEAEKAPDRVIPRLKAMLGPDVRVRARLGVDLHLPVPADGAVPARAG